MKKHIVTTVDKYGYARLHEDIHYYRVPHTYIGKKVQLSYTVADVEIRYNYEIIAHHTRDRHNYRYTTVTEHLCPKHRAVMAWSPERFLQQAAAIHEDVEHYIRRILEKTRYQDQANKICSGILNFARKVGPDRLAAACRLAEVTASTVSLRIYFRINRGHRPSKESHAERPEIETRKGAKIL